MKKEKIYSSEIFPIVYSLMSLHIILAIFISLHLQFKTETALKVIVHGTVHNDDF